jgi:DNA-binding HxlR family transcriptional regulator
MQFADNQKHFMIHQTYDASICIMTKILDLIGGKWKPIILYLIKHDVNRFGMLQKHMPRISKKVLTAQLRELEKDNLITRHILVAKAPQIVVYRLTDKGLSLRVLIDEMIDWGMNHLSSFYSEEEIKEYSISQQQTKPTMPCEKI